MILLILVRNAAYLSTPSSCSSVRLDDSNQSESECSCAESECSSIEDSDKQNPSCHSESSSDETNDSSCNLTVDMFGPFYLGSSVSLCGAVCAVMHFCRPNKLSYTVITELQKLLELLCLAPNSLPKTGDLAIL